MKRHLYFSFVAVPIFFLLACTSAPKPTATSIEPQEEAVVGHFHIKDSANVTILTIIDPFLGANLTERYLLYPKAEKKPDHISALHYIPVPVESVAINSTTHLGFINALDASTFISAVSNPDLYYNEDFQDRIKSGEVQAIGKRNINHETLIQEKVDLLFSFAIDASAKKEADRLRSLGQQVILIAEYMEQNPLKKAEWMKVFALFFGKEAILKAEKQFEELTQNYNSIKNRAGLHSTRPSVMIGLPWNGTWYVSGGKSFQAQLINDANANYIWNTYQQEASVPLALETVYSKAMSADYWINPGVAQSKQQLLETNDKFDRFAAFKKAQVYSNYKKSNNKGANDYWESAVTRPDLLLSDLYKIFHLTKDSIADELEYYKLVE